MITIQTPGSPTIEVEHLVLDYNGTLAVDGKLIPEIIPLLKELGTKVKIHILTADTYGNSEEELKAFCCEHHVVKSLHQDIYKEDYVNLLEREKVIAIGNGTNDALMLRAAALGIVVIQQEGASMKAMLEGDIVCTSIVDALQLVQHPVRIVATLKNKT